MNATTLFTPDGLYAVDTAGAGTVRQDLDGATQGEQRRDAAHELLRERRAVWVRRGCRLLAGRLLETGTATLDDIAAELETPRDLDRRLVGAVPSTLAKAGVAVLTGYVRSTRPERHASVLAVWGLADRDAALAWLADHPELPDLDADRADRRQLELFTNDKPALVPPARVRLSETLETSTNKELRHG